MGPLFIIVHESSALTKRFAVHNSYWRGGYMTNS